MVKYIITVLKDHAVSNEFEIMIRHKLALTKVVALCDRMSNIKFTPRHDLIIHKKILLQFSIL